jgi:hypothetical protein
MQRWEYCYIVSTHEAMILYSFTPEGTRWKEYKKTTTNDYKNLIVDLLKTGWEPVGNDHFKRPYQEPGS